jgi:hypothetical protein
LENLRKLSRLRNPAQMIKHQPKEALIKASLPNFNFYWLGKWPPQ